MKPSIWQWNVTGQQCDQFKEPLRHTISAPAGRNFSRARYKTLWQLWVLIDMPMFELVDTGLYSTPSITTRTEFSLVKRFMAYVVSILIFCTSAFGSLKVGLYLSSEYFDDAEFPWIMICGAGCCAGYLIAITFMKGAGFVKNV
ncbi:hypothetical protein GJV05_03075 [Pantoea agglomerans]|uniref:hypothetical protein n=1 Tax=Enterobacter agglomerans TaxID=549 RepID=UPI0012ADA587|nr:hypothetical protein [Pantoea agglomerans]MRT06989.1 hypothetical protein [Pantoea agglomerans]